MLVNRYLVNLISHPSWLGVAIYWEFMTCLLCASNFIVITSFNFCGNPGRTCYGPGFSDKELETERSGIWLGDSSVKKVLPLHIDNFSLIPRMHITPRQKQVWSMRLCPSTGEVEIDLHGVYLASQPGPLGKSQVSERPCLKMGKNVTVFMG